MQIAFITLYVAGALILITAVVGILSWRHQRKPLKPLQATIDWTWDRGHSSDTPLN